MTTSSQSFSMKARKAGSSGPEAASHQPRSVAAAQVAASVSTPKTRTSGILVASAPASDAPMSPRPTTAMAEKGALGATGAGSGAAPVAGASGAVSAAPPAPFSSADSVMEVSVSSIDQVPVATHCIRSRRPRTQTPTTAAFSARLTHTSVVDRIPPWAIY